MTETNEAGWLSRIGQMRRQGNHLAAFDLSMQALEIFPESMPVEHQAILALARSGALAGALRRYEDVVARGMLDEIGDPVLAADFAGLAGRLFKDRAARLPAELAHEDRLRSAEAYAAGYRHFGGYYLAVNAAAMFLAAGQNAPAREYAASALSLAEQGGDYWAAASAAEAALILGDAAAARMHLRKASVLCRDHFDESATTRRQLRWIVHLTSAPSDLPDELPAPLVLNWTSIAQSAAIAAFEPGGKAVLAFGPLLRPGDLLVAEALLAGGAHVHLALPASPVRLREQVTSGSAALGEIYDAVFRHAHLETSLVTAEGAAFEPAARRLCQTQARGLALLRAQALETAPVLLRGQEGTGHLQTPLPASEAWANEQEFPACPPAQCRQPHAILFGDVRGFSALDEAQQLQFLEHIIGGFADVLDAVPAFEYAETAGDGIFIVLSDIRAAAECCFALRDVVQHRAGPSGLPSLGIRLSAHIGPLYRRLDRVIGREKFCGMEVIRTARIEPVTPVGEIFVTEQFAAALACAAGDAFICEYAGLQPMAKGFGACRMYSLRRNKSVPDEMSQPSSLWRNVNV